MLNETPAVPATLYVGDFVNPQSYLNFGNKGDYEVALWRVTMDLEFHDVGIFQRFCNINIKDGADAVNLEGLRIGRYDGGNIEVVTGTAAGQNTTTSSTLVPYNTRVTIRIERTVDTTDIFIDDVEVSYSSQNTYAGANLWGTGNTQFGRQNTESSTNFDGILYSMKYEEINSSGVVQQEIINLQPVSDNTLTSWTNTGTEAPASSDGLWVLGTVVQDDQWVVNP